MMSDAWEYRWEPTKFSKDVDISLNKDQEMVILRKAAQTCPELLQVLLENPSWYCPFPFECNRFPCGERGCNADMCDNGYAFRYS